MDLTLTWHIFSGMLLVGLGLSSLIGPQVRRAQIFASDEPGAQQTSKLVKFLGIALSLVGVILLSTGLFKRFGAHEGLITRHKIVTIAFAMFGNDGNVMETSQRDGPLNYMHGTGELPSGLEEALEGKQAGDNITVILTPDKAYGVYDSNLVQSVSRSLFEGEVEPGMRFEGEIDSETRNVQVVAVDGDQVKVDANEPYAGQTVRFEVLVVSVRNATTQEMLFVNSQSLDKSHVPW